MKSGKKYMKIFMVLHNSERGNKSMNKEEIKTIYYEDELNDEFSEAKIIPRKIDENYKYIHKNIIWNTCAFLVQNVLSIPIKYLYANLK